MHSCSDLGMTSGNSLVGAVERGRPELLRSILAENKGFGLDDLAKGLHTAAKNGNEDCLQILLEADALPNIHDGSGFTPLIIAAKGGYDECVRLLIQARCNVNKATFGVRATALHWAATRGHVDCMELLIRAGCKVDMQTMHRRTPLMLAARANFEDAVTCLVRAGAGVDLVESNRFTALHYCAEEGNTESARALLRAGANLNLRSKYGDTPIMLAAQKGRLEMVQLLLRRAAVDLTGHSRHMSVLHWAAHGGNAAVVGLLLEYYMDIDEMTQASYYGGEFVVNRGVTPLMIACRGGFHDTVKLLLDKGAKHALVDEDGMTALLYAIFKKKLQCVQVLLDDGADPNGVIMQNVGSGTEENFTEYDDYIKGMIRPQGSVPIVVAVEKGYLDIVKALLRANCDLEVMSFCAQIGGPIRPFEWALLMGHTTMCQMFLIAGHQINPAFMDKLKQEITQCEESAEGYKLLLEELASPPPLMQLGRNCVRRSLGNTVLRTVGELPLPSSLLKYIKLCELDEV